MHAMLECLDGTAGAKSVEVAALRGWLYLVYSRDLELPEVATWPRCPYPAPILTITLVEEHI